MQDFQIESAQNVGIEHRLASIGERVLAWFIDIAVLIGYNIIVSMGMNALDLPPEMDWVYWLVLGLPYLLYHLLMETFAYGQSLGKMVLKIRVVRIDGSKAGFSDYLLRWVLRLIDLGISFGSVAVITILLNGKGQRLGDIAAKTTVISEKRKVSYRDTIHVDLPENHQPKYPQVSVFSDSEFQTIKSIFTNAKITSNHKVIVALARKTEKMMDVKAEERPIDFLEIVVKDYNYYALQ